MKPKTPKILEKTVKEGVRNFLRFEGWYVINCFQGLGCFPGLSDLICIKKGVVLFIEIKTATGKQSEHQIKFEHEIKSRNGNYLVIRSVDEIIALLKPKCDEAKKKAEA